MTVGERPATRLWREALAQFDELLQLPHAEREQRLAQIAQSRPQLHSMLTSLLASEAQAESSGFLEPRHAGSAADLGEGSQLGPYRIISKVGSGGMGEVWLARRDDGLYEGKVAIKTLHPHFGGAMRERFLREAQLLGRLTHPNIARLLDAGATPAGNLFLVLEHVRGGVAIDGWCDSRRLPVSRRLELFLEVCSAVAHAHANLVVHRDLKPSNILVTENALVKLLDFGVAKLLESDETPDRTELTRMTGRFITPEYAAPEQFLGEPVTTATDVYALGVLLHVLLTSALPYKSRKNAVEIERAVLHDEPTRPSRALDSVNANEVAVLRSTTTGRLQRALRGDLDNIIACALSKDAGARYASVLALADDVRRHLRHQPILARPENLAARTRKFVRRHRAGVAASVLVVAALGASVAGVVWQGHVARNEARKANAIRDFLIGVFERNSVSHPDGAKARQVTAEELLAKSVQQIRTGLHDAPDVRMELLGVMAHLYAGMEMQKDAVPLYQDLLATQRSTLGKSSIAVARTLGSLSLSQMQNAEYPAAERSAQEALEIFHAHGQKSALEYALAHYALAEVSYRLGTANDGRMRRHLETMLEVLAAHHPRSEWRIEALVSLSKVALFESNFEQSLQYCEQAQRLFEAGAVESSGIVRGGVYQSIGNRLNWLSRNEEAEVYLRKAIVENEQAGGPGHPYTIDARRELGSFLGWMGRREESRDVLESALEAQQRAKGEDDPQLTAPLRLDLGRVLMMRGEYAAAERELHRVIEAWKVSGAPTAAPEMHLARLHTEQGRFDLVAKELQDVEATAVKLFGKGSWWHAVSLNRLGASSLAQGKVRDAREHFLRTRDEIKDPPGELGINLAYAEVELVRIGLMQDDPTVLQSATTLLSQIESSRWRDDMPDEQAAAHMVLGTALMRAGRLQEAQSHLEKAVSMRERMDAPESLVLAEARLYLAQQQYRVGERANARKLAEQAAKAHRAQPYVGPQYRELLADTRRLISP